MMLLQHKLNQGTLPAGVSLMTVGVAWALAVAPLSATTIPFSTAQSGQYLLIGTRYAGGPPPGDSPTDGGQDIATSNFELGANKAPVPATDNFLFDKISESLDPSKNPGTGGPTLKGAVPNLPSNAAKVFEGVGGHGNIAIIDAKGELNLSNVGVYGDVDIGIRLAAPKSGNNGSEYNKSSNSFFNDGNLFPNTYDPITREGVKVNADPTGDPDKPYADPLTRIDSAPKNGSSGNAGVTFGYNHVPLQTELIDARNTISGLAATGLLDVSKGNQGQMDGATTLTDLVGPSGLSLDISSPNSLGGYNFTLNLESGLNVIDIKTHPTGDSKDFLLNNSNFVIDGPVDAFVIFRLLGNDGNNNYLFENSNILGGNGGIGMNNILFYTDQSQNDTHFKFNNVILNHVAFWSLGANGGVIHVNDAQGCTQLIADTITLQDVRFNRCAFGEMPMTVPDAGSTLGLLALSASGLAALRRKRAA